MRTDSGGYRRDHLRALAQRVEVDQKELRIMGSKSALLRTLVAASSAKTAGFGVPSSVPKWRALHDSNRRTVRSEATVGYAADRGTVLLINRKERVLAGQRFEPGQGFEQPAGSGRPIRSERARPDGFEPASTTDLPDGQGLRIPVQPPREKYLASVFRKSMLIIRASWPGKRGGSRVVTKRGSGCDGRESGAREFRADERRFGGRRSRVVLTPRRWCQACGSIRR